jgi:hypothetical protein
MTRIQLFTLDELHAGARLDAGTRPARDTTTHGSRRA